ncbi:MAG: dihydroneopterin aldolase [Candidatus Dormibacteraceae bacterium]
MSELDRLELREMVFFGHHGALPAERELGQELTVDVSLEGNFEAARRTDRLEAALDYRVAWAAVREIVEGPPAQLLEALADRVASRLVALPGVLRVTVGVAKHPPLPGAFGAFRVVVTARAPER